ncbi:MAG: DUF1501 domain-containing protein [Pseudomonadota bacterium]
MLQRRTFLAAGVIFTTVASFSGLTPTLAQSGGRRKLLFIIQRGAADGLAELAPIGDPHFSSLRGRLLEEAESGFALDDMFSLHPALTNIAALYRQGDAAFVHATASAYRNRSHFDGQNVLETGGAEPYAVKTGWLNRLTALLRAAQPSVPVPAVALSQDIPMALRGPAETSSFTPSRLPEPDSDFLERVERLYGDHPALAAALQTGNATREMAGDAKPVNPRDSKASGALMARLMSGADGADIAMVETSGWDLHANSPRRMRQVLSRLDGMVEGFRSGMGDSWRNTLVIIATEFGRSAAINGTNGTDHGTGGVMMLLGGTVRGGRVYSDWPGLSNSQLLDGRDLRPTIAQESAISGAIAAHFGLDSQRLQSELFAHVSGSRPYFGLVA